MQKKFKLKPLTLKLSPSHTIQFNPQKAQWALQVRNISTPLRESANMLGASMTSSGGLNASVRTIAHGLPLTSQIKPTQTLAEISDQIRNVQRKKTELTDQIKRYEEEVKAQQAELERMKEFKETFTKEWVQEKCRKQRLLKQIAMYKAASGANSGANSKQKPKK